MRAPDLDLAHVDSQENEDDTVEVIKDDILMGHGHWPRPIVVKCAPESMHQVAAARGGNDH